MPDFIYGNIHLKPDKYFLHDYFILVVMYDNNLALE